MKINLLKSESKKKFLNNLLEQTKVFWGKQILYLLNGGAWTLKEELKY